MSPIHSMTGYASKTFSVLSEGADLHFKIEMKSLNHRFLDLKLRIPREWSSFEAPIRTLVESKIKRGTVEFWVERVNESGASAKGSNTPQVNFTQAEEAYRMLSDLQRRFNLSETVSLRDIVSFPEVLGKPSSFGIAEESTEALRVSLLKTTEQTLNELIQMRGEEGNKLRAALLTIVDQFKKAHAKLTEMRGQIQTRAKDKVRKRIEQAFEAYPTPDQQVRALLESRVAQEVSYALEKLDVEEELTRLIGHLNQIETILKQGGQVGKKLDFMFQELNREINTLGNKSQDLDISQEVISLKMWIEQMREQSLNLE